MTDRYRKKPVEVRAWKIGFDGQEPDWVRRAFDGGRIDWCPAGEGLYLNTLEGHMKAGIGDMLIEGVKGELYGCRADIFAATYEPAETTLADWHDELTRFAALVRAAALEAAARVTGEFAQKWWSIHCASNKHMETTRKAHDDFCALQAAIRAMKEQA